MVLLSSNAAPSPLGHQRSRLQPLGNVTNAIRTGTADAAPLVPIASAAKPRSGSSEGRAGSAMHAPTPLMKFRRVHAGGAEKSPGRLGRLFLVMAMSLIESGRDRGAPAD